LFLFSSSPKRPDVMHAEKICMIMHVLKYHRSCRRHVTWRYVEKRNGEVIASDSRCEIRRQRNRKPDRFQDYVDVRSFSSSSFLAISTGFFLIAGIAESLIRTDNKKDDELSPDGGASYIWRGPHSRSLQDPLAEHFQLTNA